MTHINEKDLNKIADALSAAVQDVAGDDAAYINLMFITNKGASSGDLFTTSWQAQEGLQDFILYLSSIAQLTLTKKEFAVELRALTAKYMEALEESTFNA